MRSTLIAGSALLLTVACLRSVAAAEPDTNGEPDRRLQAIADRLIEAQKLYSASAAVGKPNVAVLRAAQKQRTAELEALAAELEALPPEKQEFAEHQTLADVYFQLRQWDNSVRHARAALALRADAPELHAVLVRSLASQSNVDAAEEAFRAAMAACSDKAPLAAVRYNLFLANRKSGRPLVAADHLAAYLPTVRPLDKEHAEPAYLRNLEEMAQVYLQAGAGAKAVEQLDGELAAWDAVAGDGADAAATIATKIRARKVRLLVETGNHEAAVALLESQLTAVQALLDAQSADLAPVLRMAALLESAVAVAADEDRAAANEKHFQFLRQHFAKHTGSAELATAISQAYTKQLQALAGAGKADEAEALLKGYQSLLEGVADELPTRKLLAAAESLMKSTLRRLVSQQQQQALIGKPMIPLDVTAWINGSPLAADDLKGKVVLLDFWAVWCGPCRATFPHLTAWHDKYAEQGLVIVGLTRHYQYGWDAEAKQHTQVEDLSEADETAATQEFARHHGLKHRLAFMPDGSTLPESYGVSGIPHVVVIDRQGMIRMIRVGSGEKNAHDIEALLEELIHGSSAAATGG